MAAAPVVHAAPMPTARPGELLDALVLHAAFALLVTGALTLPVGPLGWRLFACVAAYNVALPLVAQWRGHGWWTEAWMFLFPLSVLQILPDWFLSDGLGVLVFPDTGFPRVGAVPAFMGGMWAVPLFTSVFAGVHVAGRASVGAGYAAAGAVALLLFVGSEALMWRIPVWYAQHVWVYEHVALYVVVPEVVLGASALFAFVHTRGAGVGPRLLAAAAVMLIYVGACALSFLLIERT